jgi:gas vesicle protein
MMSYKDGLGYFTALVAGVTTGYLVGLLTAPASGEETRRRLSWRLDEGKGRLRRKGQRVLEETATRLEHGLEGGKQKLEQILQS